MINEGLMASPSFHYPTINPLVRKHNGY